MLESDLFLTVRNSIKYTFGSALIQKIIQRNSQVYTSVI